jgi:SMODS and SLOG-associating 2TM effector domain 1/SMODS and SLOG-associating 2TM effector domain 3
MKDDDFPNYFLAGNNASLIAQSAYVNYVKWDLILMVCAAGLTIYNYQEVNHKTFFYAISGILLLVATILSLVIKNKQYEDTWYRGRALAESCKTLTWRFITCSEYFESNLTTSESHRRFTKRITEIKDEFSDLNKELNAKLLALPIITDQMKLVRALPLSDQKQYYLQHRIDHQIDWYKNKADQNKSKYERWFWAIIVAQILALLSIGFLIKFPNCSFNFVGLFSTTSACFFSWLQLKKYQENKEAYVTATSELNLIKQEAEEINSEETFSKFVLDSENAMSREHTMWLAQKRK